jgi:hypothetical protein
MLLALFEDLSFAHVADIFKADSHQLAGFLYCGWVADRAAAVVVPFPKFRAPPQLLPS